MGKDKLLRFAKTLSAHFSNFEQAQNDPCNFAHINIFFRPLSWDFLQGPSFYSEQSYDHDPWRPYRQGINLLKENNETFIIESYEILSPERFAGSGLNSELLNGLNPNGIRKREGCSMLFKEKNPGHYKGQIEPGNCCLINRQGELTYLVSKVQLDYENWICSDLGLDIKTNQQIWGGRNGDHHFRRVSSLGDKLKEEWLRQSRY